MEQIVAALLGVLALVGIPAFSWYSRRATREGRLMLRVERLGAVYGLLPASPEKDLFETHVTRAAGELNRWMDLDNLSRRRLTRLVLFVIYAVGLVGVVLVLPFLDPTNPWGNSVFGAVAGAAMSAFAMIGRYFVDRQTQRKAISDAERRDAAATAERMAAFETGERPSSVAN